MKSIIRVLLIFCVCVIIVLLYRQRRINAPSNAVLTLKPYWHNGTWVFDDERVNLAKEPFVEGIPEMINYIVKDIPNAKNGFRLLFSAEPFPRYALKLTWVKKEWGGNWYYSKKLNKDGWLCPALFYYYKKAPKELYAKAEAL